MLLNLHTPSNRGSIPASAGIGLRAQHYRAMLDSRPAVGWLEVHPENYFGDGGASHHYLERIRRDYPLSLHGVGLSLGSVDPLCQGHLAKLKGLMERYAPALVSEHLSWSSVDGCYCNDLLPLPYTEEALQHVATRVAATQEYLGCPLLVENPSRYLRYVDSPIPEWEFLAELIRRTGCRLLLDVNNLYVSACNLGEDPQCYLRGLPYDAVAEIHLAGHTVKQLDDCIVRIDTHDQPVAAAVWELYEVAIARFGPRPTLIEWDSRLPPLAELVGEAVNAQVRLEVRRARAA